MGIFDFLKSNNGITVAIKAPRSIEVASANLGIQVAIASSSQVKIDSISAELRGVRAKHKKSHGAPSIQHLGKASFNEREVTVRANKAETVELKIPIDEDEISKFEIPPENLPLASAEMKAAAAANHISNYNYCIEVLIKTEAGKEITKKRPIKLTQPEDMHVG